MLGVILAFPSAAAGAQDAPIISTTDDGKDAMTFIAVDEGATASLTVTNPGDSPIELAITGLGDLARCTDWTLTPATIAANRTSAVKVGTKCTIPESGQVQLTQSSGATIATLQVTAEESAPGVALSEILKAFGVTLGVAFGLIAVIWIRHRPVKRQLAGRPKPNQPRPDPWDAPWDEEKDNYNEALFDQTPPNREVGWEDELPGVDAKWSFTDSWATSVSAIGTLVVALLAATDVLTALLGEEPEDFLANVLVAGAIAAFLTGAAPLVTKAVGTSTKPCVGGVLLGGLLTMAGVAGQLAVVGSQFGQLGIAQQLPTSVRTLLPFALAAAVFAYGYFTLRLLLTDAFREPVNKPPVITMEQATLMAAEHLAPQASAEHVLEKAREIRRALALAAIGVKPEGGLSDVVPNLERLDDQRRWGGAQAEASAIL